MMSVREIDEKTSVKVKIGVMMAAIVTLCTMTYNAATWQSDAYYQSRGNTEMLTQHGKILVELNDSIKELTKSVHSLDNRMMRIETINDQHN